MATKLINIVALSSFLILACSYGVAPVNALSLDISPNHAARGLGHQVLAKKRRADSRRCKPRPSSSSAAVKPTSSTIVVPVVTPSITKVVVKPPVTSATPTPTSTPPPPPPSSNSGNGKVGLAWSDGNSANIKNFKTDKVSKIYNWSPSMPGGLDGLDLEYVPMCWGVKQLDQFKSQVKPGFAKHALGFNEPDLGDQSGIDPGYAATLWKQVLDPLKDQGYTLISPAVTSGSSGIPWLESFFGACKGCKVDILAVHWYGTDPQAMIDYLNQMHTTFNKPIWVTEFACQNFGGGAQCSADQVTNFMNTVTKFMDNTSWVQQYFAFGVQHDMAGVNVLNQLMNSNGQPTPLGWDYLT